MAKIIYVLLDGVGDLPDERLGGMTPLAAASTPNMDALAARGAMGDVVTVGDGIAPESDIAVFNMLGYTFGSEYAGRGVIEAIGAGMDFADGDLAMRGNFATLGGDGSIVDRRAGRSVARADAEAISAEIEHAGLLDAHGASVSIRPTVGHRVSVRIRAGGALSPEISNTDPAYERVRGMGVAREPAGKMHVAECAALDGSEAAALAARLVNEFSAGSMRVMAASGVNSARRGRGEPELGCILLRDSGTRAPSVEPISRRYARSFACIVEMPVEVGIARVLGMRGYEAGEREDYRAKAATAAGALAEHDAMYVHLKGPDEFGHDSDAEGKTRSIEEIDSGFFGTLLGKIDTDRTAVVISADHSTPCSVGGHSDDPVPVLVSGGGARGDDTARFTEADARRGSIGRLAGAQVLREAISRLRS